MLLIQIVAGERLIVDLPKAGAAELQALLGGRLEAALSLPDPFGEGDLVAYGPADQMGLQPNCELPTGLRAAGPLVIVGVDTHGATRSLSHAEVDRIILEQPAPGTPAPALPALRLIGEA